MWGSGSFSITFEDTKHPQLDKPRSQFRACVVSKDRLEILDEHGHSLDAHLDTSMGVARLSLPRTLWHTAYILPVACIVPGSFAVGVALMYVLEHCMTKDIEYTYGDFMVWGCAAAMGGAIASAIGQRWMTAASQLHRHIGRYRDMLQRSTPDPEPCDKGPARAIQAGTLLDFFAHFFAFIRDRNMYYVVSNIVFPLIAPSRLSFAEMSGPGELDFFVSHFWGHPFQDLCASIKKHAQIAGGPQLWRAQRYWICSFSNNQHKVLEELGSSWVQSSFYLALLSPRRRGTCLVVDTEALPLTRSWCLFEVAQTVELDRNLARGPADLLFCTGSGVVNEGNASIEVSLGLAKRLAKLRLQDATASSKKDQAMIEDFVKSEMGGFEKMNACVRERIARALNKAQEVVLNDFETLQATLRKEGVDEEVHPTPSSSQAL